ncbi:hypothetical protein [Bradyrhizobium yuanmingense]|uniref:hypothetical protein n=1 Tax=Bradyrhizobium yuanmingense TaxID=108015 RepID=UPI000B1D88A9|nr:hypothetical protein [Bradyrhizobium yuanmingense]
MFARMWIAGGLTLLVTGSVSAQTIADCNFALVSNKSKGEYSLRESLSIYTSLTEESFNSAKKNFGAGSDFYIGELPVKASMTWAEFNEARQKKLAEYRFNFSRQHAQAWNEVYLAPGSAEAYKACLASLAHQRLKIEINKALLAPDSPNIPITIRFDTGNDDATTRSINVNPINGKLHITDQDQKALGSFRGSLSIAGVFVRTSVDKDAILSLSIPGNASSAQIVIPARVAIQKRREERRLIQDSVVITKSVPPKHQFKESFCIPRAEDASTLDGWEIVPGSVFQGPPSYTGNGDAQALGWDIVGNGACGKFNIGTDSSASGVTATLFLRAEFRRYHWDPVD